MNITINLSTANLEIVNYNIISKLYNLISGNSQHNVTLSGNLYSATGYKLLIDTLVDRFSPNLIITVPVEGQYLIFTDSEVENILKNTIGDGEGVTLSLLKNADPNSSLGLNNNTNITDTRELCLIEGTGTNGGFCYLCTNIKTLGIPKNVTSFGYGYTEGISPEKLVIGDMVNFCKTSFGSHNFSRYNNGNGVEICTLNNDGSLTTIKDLVLPSNTLFVDNYWCMPFDNANIDSVVIPAGTNVIGGFQESKLKSMTIELGSQATKIQANAFYKCSNLVFNVANLPQSLLTIRQLAFRGSPKITGALNLPNLTSLEQYAFYNTGITGVTDLGSITLIPEYCFLYSTLQSITLPSTCTTIKSRGLSDMTTLTTVNGGSGLTTIEDYAFYNDTALTSVAGLSNVTSIGEAAFLKCSSLTGTLNLPNLVSLGNGAFQLTNITNVLNLGLVSEILDPFFNCTSITEIVLPTTLRKSGSFYNTHISKLIYPYGFTEKISGLMCGGELGRYLLYILFPSTVTKIVCDDMYRDSGNSRIRCHIVVLATTPPNTNRNPSDTSGSGLGWSWGDPSLANWYVPDAVVNTYKADTQWSSIADYIFPISQLEADSPTCWAWYQANKDYGVPAQS